MHISQCLISNYTKHYNYMAQNNEYMILNLYFSERQTLEIACLRRKGYGLGTLIHELVHAIGMCCIMDQCIKSILKRSIFEI